MCAGGNCIPFCIPLFALKGKEICLRSKSFLGKIERETSQLLGESQAVASG